MFRTAANTPARIVRWAGSLVLGSLLVSTLITASDLGGLFDVVLLGVFAVGLLAVTGRSVAVTADAITVGAGVGVVAAVFPGLAFMLWPPIPRTGQWAFAVVAAACLVAAGVIAARPGAFRLWDAVFAGLLATMVAGLLIWLVVVVMAQYGPQRWVPELVSHALTPAARLADRRHLAGEPYLSVLMVGIASATTLGVVARRRGRLRTLPPVPPAGRSRQIELGDV